MTDIKEKIIWSYGEYTKTTGLLLHYIGIKISTSGRAGYVFKDSYLYDMDHPIDGYNIYLRFTPLKDRLPNESILLAMYNPIEHYFIDEDIMLVIPIPKKYHNDIESFKDGKYSKFNLKRVAQIFGDDDLRYHICAKSAILKKRLEEELNTIISDDLELGPVPDPTKEVLNYDVSRVSEDGWPNSHLSKQGI